MLYILFKRNSLIFAQKLHKFPSVKHYLTDFLGTYMIHIYVVVWDVKMVVTKLKRGLVGLLKIMHCGLKST